MSFHELINWEEALEQFDHDEIFYKDLLADLRDEMTHQLERMFNRMNQNGGSSCIRYDYDRFRCLQQGAHAIKGAASNLLCEPLRQAAADLERGAATAYNMKEGITEEFMKVVEQLFIELCRIAEVYRQYFLQIGV